MDNIVLLENERIIFKSKTSKNIWTFLPGFASTAFGLFIMFLPLIPTELAVAPVITSFLGLVPFSFGILFFVVSIRHIVLYKNAQLILTNKKIFVYDRSQKKYTGINLTDISGWDSSYDYFLSDKSDKITWSAKFTFWTSATSITTGKISNCFETEKALSKIIKVKSHSQIRREKRYGKSNIDSCAHLKNTNAESSLPKNLKSSASDDFKKDSEKKVFTGISQLDHLISENEQILCKAEQKKHQHNGLETMLVIGIAFSIFFTASIIIITTLASDLILIRNILFYSLGITIAFFLLFPIAASIIIKAKNFVPFVLTNERFIIYDKKTKHYSWFRFNEIKNWEYSCWLEIERKREGTFIFTILEKTFIVKKISNHFAVYKVLLQKIGKSYSNPLSTA